MASSLRPHSERATYAREKLMNHESKRERKKEESIKEGKKERRNRRKKKERKKKLSKKRKILRAPTIKEVQNGSGPLYGGEEKHTHVNITKYKIGPSCVITENDDSFV